MTGVNFKLNTEEVQKALEELSHQTDNLSIPMAQISEYLLRSTRERFTSQQSPDGTPWELLSKSYQSNKKRNQDKILTYRGHLQSQLHRSSNAKQAQLGSNLVYAAIHQFGASKGQFGNSPWGKIPARPYLGLSDSDNEQVTKIIRNYIKKG